jgi:hypothetical protein
MVRGAKEAVAARAGTRIERDRRRAIEIRAASVTAHVPASMCLLAGVGTGSPEMVTAPRRYSRHDTAAQIAPSWTWRKGRSAVIIVVLRPCAT